MNIIKDISLFLLIFGVYNDNLVFDFAGLTILKLSLVQFLVIHAKDIYIAFSMPRNVVTKSFLFFFSLLFSVVLITEIFYFNNLLLDAIPRLLAVVVIFVYFSQYKNLEKVLYMIWFVMIISAIYSLFAPTINPWTFRRSGGTIDPNAFAAQLLAVMFFTVYLYRKNKNLIFLLSSLALFSYSFVYAGSKSSMLVLAVLIMYIVIVKFEYVIKKILSLNGLIGLVIVLVVAFNYNFSNIEAISGIQDRTESSGTMQQRFMAWKAGSEMIRDNFILGTGFDVFAESSTGYLDKYLSDYDGLAAHNIFIKLLAETGIFPFIAFMIALVYLLKTKFTNILKSDYFWLSLAVYATILMGLTLSIIYNKFFWIPLAFLSYAILMVSKEEDEEEFKESNE